MVGPSSGFAFVGLLNYLEKQKLENIKGKIAVVICPDSPLPYINEYFEYLDNSEFPKIENEHLLLYREKVSKKDIPRQVVKELEPQEAYKLLYHDTPEKLWEKLRKKHDFSLIKNITVLDLRAENEFQEHHIPGAENVAFHDIDTKLKKDNKLKKKKAVLFICKFGNTSRLAAWKADQAGIKAISIKGGDAEWSRLNLPRVRSDACITRFDLK